MSTGRRIAVVVGGLFALLVLGFTGATSALAHATVVSTNPVDGADLTRLPAQVSITFDESVGLQPGYLQVIDDAGHRVDTGDARHPAGEGATVVVDLRPAATGPAGYLASYRVVSADGHPVQGTFSFTVGGGAPVTTSSSATNGSSRTLAALIDLATTTSYLGFAAAGGAWLLVGRRAGVLDSRRARWIVRAGLILAAASTAVQVLLQGPYVAGDSSTASASSLLGDTLNSPFGVARLVELGALLVLLLLSWPLARFRGPLHGARMATLTATALLWCTAVTAMAASGHARVRAPVWLNLPSTVLHVLAMTTWVGGLVLLVAVVVPGGDRPGSGALTARFSRVALVSVAVLAVTGTVQAWQETGSWSALVTTTYGALLLTKIGLLAVLIGLGAVARRHVRRGDPVRALRRGVLVELGVVLAVLAVTSVLVGEPPARAAAEAAAATRTATATVRFDAGRSARVQVDPAHAGPVEVVVTLVGVTSLQSLTLTATQAAQRIGPLPVTLGATSAPDQFVATGVVLPAAGRWQFELTLRASQFDSVVGTATIDVS